MFILPLTLFSAHDLTLARPFVEFWSQYYSYAVKIQDSAGPINYVRELNLNGNLSQEQVIRLLRWKDPQYLSFRIQSGPNSGVANPRVERVLQRLDEINAFRGGVLDEAAFLQTTSDLFPSGWIWRCFLFHIARPAEYPILDQHVCRAFQCHTGYVPTSSWELYGEYRVYFQRIADAAGFSAGADLNEIVGNLKRVDDALMSFGQFLKTYWALNPSALPCEEKVTGRVTVR